MRILHLSTFLIPGMRYQENILPAEQALLGHEVTVIASDLMPGVAGALALRDEPDAAGGVRVLRLRGLRLGRDAQIRLGGLREAVRSARPDIVHLHGLWFWLDAQALRAWRGPVLADDHTDNGNAPQGFSGVLTRWAGRRTPVRAVLARAGGRGGRRKPLAVRYLRQVLGAPADRVDHPPRGWTPACSVRMRRRGRGSARGWGWGGAEVVLCTSGRLVPGKGLDLLLEAFALVAAANPQARLLVIGDGPESCRAALRARADRLGVAGRVVWEGLADAGPAERALQRRRHRRAAGQDGRAARPAGMRAAAGGRGFAGGFLSGGGGGRFAVPARGCALARRRAAAARDGADLRNTVGGCGPSGARGRCRGSRSPARACGCAARCGAQNPQPAPSE
ncbi:MAG: glycosyltransferase [Kiritimatiellia bacterium]